MSSQLNKANTKPEGWNLSPAHHTHPCLQVVLPEPLPLELYSGVLHPASLHGGDTGPVLLLRLATGGRPISWQTKQTPDCQISALFERIEPL